MSDQNDLHVSGVFPIGFLDLFFQSFECCGTYAEFIVLFDWSAGAVASHG
ncbi:predicted protein [Pyrenophora tritici-repentis Pt-1C-BFP]|uniref:Uncharacterized protein n=1 Tax=Pyrenophora tritici-repentis (strain Pt-1C-BFP) TaxID=426418 RepID=B2VT54_PYRTR|nr:uncharacterized protein PTRG_01890 [Pyrenophora tritici-repentis Pt-1C-BFP]EDU41328.1 predicted protein [Pyrenophora tritici-repentis Pt-1C-BFP]